MTTDTLIRVEDLQMHFKNGEIKALDGVSLEVKKVKSLSLSGRPAPENLRCCAA